MTRTLVIGYGNVDQADDGATFFIVNALRRRLGQTPLEEADPGLSDLGSSIDSVFLVQLVPELVETLVGYDLVIFVDAHAQGAFPNLHCQRVAAERIRSSYAHHMTPPMLLSLLMALHQREPVAYIVAVRGYDFSFHRDLSPGIASLIEPAAEQIVLLARGQ